MQRIPGGRRLGWIGLALTLLARPAWSETRWGGWRGPQMNGHSQEMRLPVKWNAGDIAWKVQTPGKGQSSPVIWDDRVFLTSALENGKQRVVLCLSRTDGKLLWQQTAWTGEPEATHAMNGWASATTATDGERVYAFFGRGGLHCYTVEGKPVWTRDLGDFKGPWGTASSPLLHENLLVINGDSEENAYLLAVDKKTGQDVWRTPRPNDRGWSSPLLLTHEGQPQIVVNGHQGVRSYDPKTGAELWYCKSFNGRGETTVALGQGLVQVINGLQGDVYAVKPNGQGNVTATHMAWHTPRKGGRDLPSPITVGPYMFVVNMQGVANCYDAATGKEFERLRLKGNFSASPIAAGGRIFIPNEAGVTYVLKAGENIEIEAENAVDPAQQEVFRSAITPCQGQMFLRSDLVLYCIGKPQAGAE